METCIIFTCQQESEELCINELLKTGWDIHFHKWLSQGVGVACYRGTFLEFATKARAAELIFLRHIFPVDHKIQCLSGKPSQPEDYAAILNELANRMCRNDSFSVQFRCGANEKQSLLPETKQATKAFFQERGLLFQVNRPVQVISGFLSDGYLYIGLSSSWNNLSDWPGGMRAYALRDDTISRAEFKLLETIEYFNISLTVGGTAIDLGAAPGGWTKVLTENGLRVTAVDPAELAPAIAKNPNVMHYRGPAQRFLNENRQEFDVAVNDMRMDTIESVKIMNEMACRVKRGGLIIMTFKLQKTNKTATIRKGLELLSKQYRIVHAKQMFHNRCEITVVAYRKDNQLSTTEVTKITSPGIEVNKQTTP